jgi:hypothetical protein
LLNSSSLKFKLEDNQASRRMARWQLQRAAQALLPQERVAFCMRRCQASTVDVMYSSSRQSTHYQGLMACGSIWVCPVCSAKISEHRRIELERAIARCIANGGVVYLATYTIAHNRYDNLSDLLQAFLTARKKAKQGYAAQNLRSRFGILGTVSVREVTWSKLNGWHPHCHELVFFSQEIEEDAVVLGTLSHEQWAVVLRNDARGKLLEVARSGDWQTWSRIGDMQYQADTIWGSR